jgi:soluble lytic murein transglycosylase-like protein
MYGKMLGSLLLAAVVTSRPAAAADDIAVNAVPPEAAGFSVEGNPDGFQLVTHGVWQAPTPAAEPRIISGDTVLNEKKPTTRLKPSSRASSFRRATYLPHVYAAEVQNRLPTGLLDALIWTESRYNPLAVSSAGAAGLGQLMPGTARDLGVANRFDPRSNLSGAARYLRQMLDRFGLVHLALAAYNAGPGAVERSGGVPRNGETPDYVRRVIEFWGSK